MDCSSGDYLFPELPNEPLIQALVTITGRLAVMFVTWEAIAARIIASLVTDEPSFVVDKASHAIDEAYFAVDEASLVIDKASFVIDEASHPSSNNRQASAGLSRTSR